MWGFLSALAAPFLKGVAQSAWTGIKGIASNLFSEGKQQVVQGLQTGVKTIGQRLVDNAYTIGQTGSRPNAGAADTSIQDEQLKEKMNILEAQQQILPPVQRFRVSGDIPYKTAGGLYKNHYPGFRSFHTKSRFQNQPSHRFSDMKTQQRITPMQFDDQTDFMQNRQEFKPSSRYNNQDFFDNLQKQKEHVDDMFNSNQLSGFERAREMVQERDDYDDDVEYASPVLGKKFKF